MAEEKVNITCLQKQRLVNCIKYNWFVIAVLMYMFVYMGGLETLEIGPSPDLKVLAIPIDTWDKYMYIICVTGFVQVAMLINEEFGIAVIEFNVYDPTLDEIRGFNRMELQIYSNTLYFTYNAIKNISLFILISRIDLAFYSLIIEEIATVFTIYIILSGKKFISHDTIEKIIN
jgi:hypothetical protein